MKKKKLSKLSLKKMPYLIYNKMK